QGTGTAGGPACGCISIASITPVAWIGRAVGGLASMGFIFHIYRKALRSGRERRAERHLGGSLSRLALRVDFYRGALRTRTESRATALFGRLETAVADHEQSGLGAAEGDSQPVCEFHQRRGQACVGGTTAGLVWTIADRRLSIDNPAAPSAAERGRRSNRLQPQCQ